MRGFRFLVLPPEASTNWVFDDAVVFNLLIGGNRFIMDRRDYDRYRRLAASSDIDFYKYFTLTLLASKRLVRFLNYKNWYNPEAIVRSLGQLLRSTIMLEPDRFIERAVEAYGGYRNYVGNKTHFLGIAKNAKDSARLDQETSSTDHDLALLHSGKVDPRHHVAYLSRIATKLLAAESIAMSLRSAGHDADVFDSMEYFSGTQILGEAGIEMKTRHAVDMFQVNKAQEEITKELSDRGVVVGETMLGVPVRLIMGIQENLYGSMVGQLRAEINNQNTLDNLEQEVEDCVHGSLWPKEDYRKKVENYNTVLSLVEVVSSTLGSWGLSFLAGFVCRVLPARDFDSGYTVAAQLIARAVHLRRDNDQRCRRTRNWVQWFRRVFLKKPLEDSVWESSQRDMKDWTNPVLYVPWWEGGGMWQLPLWTPADIWERKTRRSYIRSKKKRSDA